MKNWASLPRIYYLHHWKGTLQAFCFHIPQKHGNLNVDYQSGGDEAEGQPDICEDVFEDVQNEFHI